MGWVIIMSDQNKVTQAEFARMQGWSRSHVTGLKHAGRLVTEGKGRELRVLVKESLAEIEATKDPNRDDVAKRHAEARAGDEQPAALPDDESKHSYQKSRARKEHFLSKQAEADYQKMIGELVDIGVVQKAGAELGTLLRTQLENLQDQLSAELAPETDPARIYALLGQHFEYTLTEISRKLGEEVKP